jgi:hypothetical protein
MKTNKIKNILNINFKRFIVYVYYTAKPDFINPIYYFRRLYDYQCEVKFKKIDNGELYHLIKKITEKSKSTGCEYSDYFNLYDSIIKRKAKNVLELGSGISTCVIAYALMKLHNDQNSKGIVVTMEESDFYHKNFLKIIPDELKIYIKSIYSPRKKSSYFNVIGCHYEDIPSIESGYDFVFIDAPQTIYPGERKKCFDSDLINLINENKLNNPYVILDQRIGSLWTLNKLIPNLHLKYNPFKKQSSTVFKTS